MVEKFRRSCQALLSPWKSYLVALSGGADSVALLRLLLSQNYKLEAVHCNFHLRGEESDRDESFCKELCDNLKVPLHLAHFDTKTYAEVHGVSIEMAARTLRYEYFFKLIDDLHFDGVCVAHHRDDSVETVLLNMVRGTGIEGMKGILPRNGKVLRPMLDVSRQDIEAYLSMINQEYITDSTNLSDDVQRNKVRLNVIPELQKVTPSAVDNIQKLTRYVQDAMEILSKAVDEAVGRVSKENDNGEMTVSIPSLHAEPGAETVLWNLLKDKDFSSQQVEQIMNNIDGQSGREWLSPTHSLLIDRDTILVQRKTELQNRSMRIPEMGTYVYDSEKKFRFCSCVCGIDFVPSRKPECVHLDASKVKFPLCVRTVQTGDWFIPFGMTGKKLLSDFLTDRKQSLFEKRRQLVVVDSTDAIVWVVGIRPDNRFRITDATEEVIEISFIH